MRTSINCLSRSLPPEQLGGAGSGLSLRHANRAPDSHTVIAS